MTHQDFTKGIEAVRGWCEKNNVTPSKLAIGLGRDPSSMRRLLKGQRAPSLEFALDIQRATKGDVPISIWGIWTTLDGDIVRKTVDDVDWGKP